jgi:hypothetical protein
MRRLNIRSTTAQAAPLLRLLVEEGEGLRVNVLPSGTRQEAALSLCARIEEGKSRKVNDRHSGPASADYAARPIGGAAVRPHPLGPRAVINIKDFYRTASVCFRRS